MGYGSRVTYLRVMAFHKRGYIFYRNEDRKVKAKMLNTLEIRHKYIIFKEYIVNFKHIVDLECLFKYV